MASKCLLKDIQYIDVLFMVDYSRYVNCMIVIFFKHAALYLSSRRRSKGNATEMYIIRHRGNITEV